MSDAATVRDLLSQTAAAITFESRLLIDDIVLADTGETVVRAAQDIQMLLLCDGQARVLASGKQCWSVLQRN